jgi:tight adherence protein C
MSPALLLATVTLATGVWMVVQHVPTPRPPDLRDRVLPYLGLAERSARTDLGISSALGGGFMSAARRAAAHVGVLSGGDRGVQRRLETLGDERSVEQFRMEQVLWGGGLGVVVLLVTLATGVATSDPVPTLIAVALATILGVLLRDRVLTAAVERRSERLRVELPTIIEMVAMAVGAGSGLLAGLERISQIGHGVASVELSRVVTDTRAGLPLVPALHRMADRNDVHELRRFVDSVTVAVERGTPLADVLVAQASDAREAGRRALIESGGRKEIAMMVPIVFLVLPLSVVFVLFPGFYGIQLGS